LWQVKADDDQEKNAGIAFAVIALAGLAYAYQTGAIGS